eukprot:m.28811 g.28811  ORF g.28811 m.28811 type:complete len:157 (-) comp6092_c0_seq1:249-719(-)
MVFSQEQMKEFKLAFDTYDEDANGKLDSDIVGRALRACGIPLSTVEEEKVTTDIDLYSDSEIGWDGFLALLEELQRPLPTPQALGDAFKKIDQDGSGTISTVELTRYLTNIGDSLSKEEMAELIKDFDGDGDGEISYKEFVSFITGGVTYSTFQGK